MLTRKEFMSLYDGSISMIRQVKQSNDKFNKNIGLENDSFLLKQIDQQNPKYNQIINQLQENVQKLQANYLDPDTARKIGTLKQQLKGQKDRREHLKSNLKLNSQIQSQNTIYKSNNYHSRTQYTQNSTIKSSTMSEKEIQRQLHNEMQLEEQVLRANSKELVALQRSFSNIHNISLQTHRLAVQQGQKLDIIDVAVGNTLKNALDANQQLNEAQLHQRKTKKKYFVGSIIIILVVIAILAIIVM